MRRRAVLASRLADHADIRTVGDALAFLACAGLFVALAWMVTHPREFFAVVMGLLP